MNRPCRRVHRVFNKRERSYFRPAWTVGHVRFDAQRPYGHISLDVGQILLRHHKVDGDRGEPFDDHDRHVGDLHQIPRLNENCAGASVHGRVNLAVLQIQLRRFKSRFIGSDRGLGRIRGAARGLRI